MPHTYSHVDFLNKKRWMCAEKEQGWFLLEVGHALLWESKTQSQRRGCLCSVFLFCFVRYAAAQGGGWRKPHSRLSWQREHRCAGQLPFCVGCGNSKELSQYPPLLALLLPWEPAITGLPLLLAQPCHWSRNKCSCWISALREASDLVANKLFGEKVANE